SLIESLRGQASLLVLDNFEHLLDAASEVAALLTACPALTVLVTSRIPLHLSAEREYPVRPLPLPDQVSSVHAAAEIDAVQLFVDRARAVQPAFALTPDTASAIVRICRQLDGLPL